MTARRHGSPKKAQSGFQPKHFLTALAFFLALPVATQAQSPDGGPPGDQLPPAVMEPDYPPPPPPPPSNPDMVDSFGQPLDWDLNQPDPGYYPPPDMGAPTPPYGVTDMSPPLGANPLQPPPLATPAPDAAPAVPAPAQPEAVAVEEASPPAVEAPPVEAPAPEVVATEEAAPEVEVRDGLTAEEEEAILASPSRSIELYEKVRQKRLVREATPRWSANFTFVPHAFANTELRVGQTFGPNDKNGPYLAGVLFSAERMFFHSFGNLALGLEGGGYFSNKKDEFTGLMPGFQAAGPYLQYQGHFVSNQLLVPTLRAGAEAVRYRYTYDGRTVSDISTVLRADIGLLLYLNFFEAQAAHSMDANWGIKRTYLAGYYSLSRDASKMNFDLSENALKVGLRLEF